jgi:hypothetical protein
VSQVAPEADGVVSVDGTVAGWTATLLLRERMLLPASLHAPKADVGHDPRDGATRHGVALASQLLVDPARPVAAVVSPSPAKKAVRAEVAAWEAELRGTAPTTVGATVADLFELWLAAREFDPGLGLAHRVRAQPPPRQSGAHWRPPVATARRRLRSLASPASAAASSSALAAS